MDKATCLNCSRTDEQTPLLNLIFKGEEKYICPQCLPILIHKPYQLAEILPDFTPSENPPPDDH